MDEEAKAVKRLYYTAVIVGIYGTAGLALAVAAICSGCGSAAQRLPGDRGPALIARVGYAIPPLPAAVTYTPPVPIRVAPPTNAPSPTLAPVATIQPVGPPVAGPQEGDDARIGPPPARGG